MLVQPFVNHGLLFFKSVLLFIEILLLKLPLFLVGVFECIQDRLLQTDFRVQSLLAFFFAGAKFFIDGIFKILLSFTDRVQVLFLSLFVLLKFSRVGS